MRHLSPLFSSEHPTSLVDAEGHAARAGYDEDDNLIYSQDALGDRLTRTSSGLVLEDGFGQDSLSSYTTAVQGDRSYDQWQRGVLAGMGEHVWLLRDMGHPGDNAGAVPERLGGGLQHSCPAEHMMEWRELPKN